MYKINFSDFDFIQKKNFANNVAKLLNSLIGNTDIFIRFADLYHTTFDIAYFAK